MFTALNAKVAAGFELGNNAIKEGYDAVKNVPGTIKSGFIEQKSWVQDLATTTGTGGSLDMSVINNFPTMTLEHEFTTPRASAPTFGPGEANP